MDNIDGGGGIGGNGGIGGVGGLKPTLQPTLQPALHLPCSLPYAHAAHPTPAFFAGMTNFKITVLSERMEKDGKRWGLCKKCRLKPFRRHLRRLDV